MEFIQGYKRGYQERGLLSGTLQTKSPDFKRGYIEARKDFKANEPALY